MLILQNFTEAIMQMLLQYLTGFLKWEWGRVTVVENVNLATISQIRGGSK